MRRLAAPVVVAVTMLGACSSNGAPSATTTPASSPGSTPSGAGPATTGAAPGPTSTPDPRTPTSPIPPTTIPPTIAPRIPSSPAPAPTPAQQAALRAGLLAADDLPPGFTPAPDSPSGLPATPACAAVAAAAGDQSAQPQLASPNYSKEGTGRASSAAVHFRTADAAAANVAALRGQESCMADIARVDLAAGGASTGDVSVVASSPAGLGDSAVRYEMTSSGGDVEVVEVVQVGPLVLSTVFVSPGAPFPGQEQAVAAAVARSRAALATG